MSKKKRQTRMLGKDTISYTLDYEENTNYEQEMVQWKEYGEWESDKPMFFNRKFYLIINNEIIKQYTDPHELLRVTCARQCYETEYNSHWSTELLNTHECSYFEVFTCSCGISGCAGIYDGINLKVRKHTVEWRMKKNRGYDFLDKRFFQFDRKQYFDMIDKLRVELKDE